MEAPEETHFSIRVFTELSPELESLWRALAGDCDHFGFQSFDWLSHWQRTIGSADGVRPQIAIAERAGSVIALFPFGLRRVGGVRTIEFLGGAQSDYNAPLIHPAWIDAGSIAAIWSNVLAALPRHDLRVLSRIPSRLNRAPNPVLAVWSGRVSHSACAATLSGSWEEYQSRISKNVRNDSRRQMKKLGELGEVVFVIASDDREFDELVSAMVEQKRRRFAETGARDALATASVQAFYRGLRGQLGGNGRVHLSALRVNDTVVATHWGIVYGDRFYYLMPTFAGGPWRTLSVGRLLQERLMQWSLENGLRYFDFSVGDERYKRTWCDLEMLLSENVETNSIRGRAYYAALRCGWWFKTNKTMRRALMSMLRIARSLGKRREESPGTD